MYDPFLTLGLDCSSDTESILTRYLELVRQFPPEREPQKAAEIRAAYDAIRDPVGRLQNILFEFRSTETIGELIAEARQASAHARLPTETLLSLGMS